MMALGWLLLAGMIWWGFDIYLNPNARLAEVSAATGEVVLKRGPDGHFRAPGRIDGQPVAFLVDTGATVVAVPAAVAERLGLHAGVAERVVTANGTAVAYATRLTEVDLGGARAGNVPADIVPGMAGNEVLLGMSFLARFEITMNGNAMSIRPR
ncbi:TIGR02281 family clan AA aspartic protease [Parasulfuritortus cantonensis]|uniref:TIGR02281 family clan AA aspartic protease n=2 Tax=Parasulfuritortus cantonensis TaxID=2528202 RepID=A0A4R1B8H0_9PROT|nr:TIGR02281 family clan AA aspartic protease [Parasulfuritortus cantonensis]